MPHWVYPLDPECPGVEDYNRSMADEMDHPMPGAPYDEMADDFNKRHRAQCTRCQEYGAANVEVE